MVCTFNQPTNENLSNGPVLFIDGLRKELRKSWPLFNGNGFFLADANNYAVIT